MIKIIFILLLICSSLFPSNNKIILQLNWKNQFQFAGYYIAKELGYYETYNLDVKIKEYENGINTVDEVIKKKAQFAVGRSSIIVDKENGKDIVAIAAIYQHSPLMLLTRDDTGINSIKDLENKKIMMTNDATSSASIMAMLTANNISLDKITFIKHSFNVEDLINKNVDAMASYVSNESIIMQQRNIGYKIFHPKDYGFSFYSDILFTSNKYLKSNPENVRKFYEASLEGWEYAFKNIERTAQIIFEKYNTQNKSLKNLIEEGKELKKLAYNKITRQLGSIDKNKIENIIYTYKVFGLITKNIDIDSFVYENNKKGFVEIKLRNDYFYLYLIIILLIVLFLIFILIYLNHKKKWLITKNTLEDEIKEQTKIIQQQALKDPLTNVYNRKAYNFKIKELLNNLKRYEIPFSILTVDLDNFKQVNDNFGHHTGDKILKNFTKIVSNNIRINDEIFRMGGEEFTIVFPNTELATAKIVANKILELIRINLKIDKNTNVTISGGLIEVKKEDNEITLYKRADELLYKSKKAGKDRITVCTD